jgi:hypothetical protein
VICATGLKWLALPHLTWDAEETLRRLERLLRAVHVEAQHADARARRLCDEIVQTWRAVEIGG